MKRRIFLTMVVTITSVLLLSACGVKQEDEKRGAGTQDVTGKQPADITKTVKNFDDEGGIVPALIRKTKMDTDLMGMVDVQMRGDVCYYYRHESGGEERSVRTVCAKQDAAGKEEIVFSYESTEEQELFMRCCRVDREGNWYNLLLQSSAESGQEDMQQVDQESGQESEQRFGQHFMQHFVLEKRNAQGETVYQTTCEEYGELFLSEGVLDGAVTEEGCFLALTRKGTLLFFNEEGKEKGSISLWRGDMETEGRGLADAGRSGIFYYECKASPDEVSLQQIRIVEQKLDKEVVAKIDGTRNHAGVSIAVYDGYREGLLLADTTGLFRCSALTGETSFLFAWADSNVNVNYQEVELAAQNDEGTVLFTVDRGTEESFLALVAEVDAGSLAPKQVISIGCLGYSLENLERLAVKYNAQSTDYKVELVVYGGEVGTFSVSAAVDKMAMDLLHGEGPDLFEMYGISQDAYVSKGIMEELSPYLERSGVRLVEPVREALSLDGGLYTLSDSFILYGYICPKGYAVDGGLSVDGLRALAEDYPKVPLTQYANAAATLRMILKTDLDTYLDLSVGSCSFDDGRFLDLLEMVKGFKENTKSRSEWAQESGSVADMLYRKEYLMESAWIECMETYLELRDAFGGEEAFVELCGYPNQKGEERYPIDFGTLFGMNAASQKKEGAWDFLKWLLSKAHQAELVERKFPIVEEFFEESLNVEYVSGGMNFYQFLNRYTNEMTTDSVANKEDKERMRAIVNHAYYSGELEKDIQSIISDETWDYFDGSQTAQMAVEHIQSRVGLYLKERQ